MGRGGAAAVTTRTNQDNTFLFVTIQLKRLEERERGEMKDG